MTSKDAGQRVVVTTLHTYNRHIKAAVEDMVQVKSTIETLGVLVYTLVVYSRLERGLPITKTYCDQSFMNACFRAVSVRKDRPTPISVVYTPDRTAQNEINRVQALLLTSVAAWPDDTGLTQTLNQASRRYLTCLQNGLFMHMEKRQTKILYFQVKGLLGTTNVHGYTINHLRSMINGTPTPNGNLYKDQKAVENGRVFCASMEARALVTEHRDRLPEDRGGDKPLEYLIKANTHEYLAYHMYLAQVVEGSDGALKRFQFIPQLRPKARSISFSPRQVCELITRIIRLDLVPAGELPFVLADVPRATEKKSKVESLAPDANGKRKGEIGLKKPARKRRKREATLGNVTQAQWIEFAPQLTRLLFQVPKRQRKRFTGTVTTNGVSASWHVFVGPESTARADIQKKRPKKKSGRKKKKPDPDGVNRRSLKSRHTMATTGPTTLWSAIVHSTSLRLILATRH
jgi:hypothetical protein